jgi:hypothetical protein
MVTEEITETELVEIERGAAAAQQDLAAGQVYASYHAWCSDPFKDGYALALRFRRYHAPQTNH